MAEIVTTAIMTTTLITPTTLMTYVLQCKGYSYGIREKVDDIDYLIIRIAQITDFCVE